MTLHTLSSVFVALYRSALVKIPKFFIRFSFRSANVFAIWITSKLSVNFLWQLTLINDQHTRSIQIQCKKRRDCNFSIENTTLKWSEKFRTMAVHCSSNVILLAIEYFIDSKEERQNIKLLPTQNNYSPSFGLKKLVIFFISSDNSAGAGSTKQCKPRCRTKRRGGQGMVFDKGASRPQGTITAKSTGTPQNAWRLKLTNVQRI